MASSLTTVDFKAVRVIVHSTLPFDTIVQALYAEIGSPEQAGWFKAQSRSNPEDFTEAVRKATKTAPGEDVTDHFMIFQVRRPLNVSPSPIALGAKVRSTHSNFHPLGV